MATLTSSYQYLGRSDVMKSNSGSLNYYMLLFAKTTTNNTTGIHTVTTKGYLASTNANATFYQYATWFDAWTNDVRVAYGNNYPNSAWDYNGSGESFGGVTYKTYTKIFEASTNVDCSDGLEKTIKLGWYYEFGGGEGHSYTPTYGTKRSLYVDVNLAAIPRASQPKLSAYTVQMGNTVTISTNRLSSSFTHNLTYSFGSGTGTIANDVGASYTWKVPDLVSYIPNQTSGTCTITCKTYSGSTYIGQRTVSLSLTIPNKSTPSASASTVKMGTSVSINTNQNSSAYTHTLTYTFGSTTETIKTGVVDSHSWQIPDLAHLCNNKVSDTCKITCITYNGSFVVGEAICNITLNVQDKTVPSFPNGDVIIGSGNPITTKANSNNFTHIIRYSFNGKTGTVDDEKKKSDIVWWTPYDLASYIPSNTSGNGTITCETYNGTALVGTSDPVSFKAIVPENSTTKPSFVEAGFVLSPSGNLDSVFNGLYIQGKTGVKAQFTASSPYSNIASYKMSVEGRVYEGNPAISNILNSDGNVEVVGTVTDARRYYTPVPTSISVIPYRIPRIDPYDGDKEIICERCNQSGVYNPAGTYLHIRAKRTYYPVNQKNMCHLKLRYKATGGSWSEEKTLLSGTDTSTDLYDNFKNGYISGLNDVALETDRTYLVQLIVQDTMGERIPYDFPISTDKVTLHLGLGGHGVAVGKYSEATADDEYFESGWNAKFHANLYAKHIESLGQYDGNDFDDFVYQTGYYIGISAPSASDCRNYPVDKTGILEVISAMQQDWGYSYQTYRTHDGEVYMRSYNSSTGFSAWKKISV